MDNCDNGKNFLKKEIMSLNFAINDLSLFLDTHPNNKRALELHNEYVEKLTDLTKKYQELYGPLTVNFTADSWIWSDEPWPWERSDR